MLLGVVGVSSNPDVQVCKVKEPSTCSEADYQNILKQAPFVVTNTDKIGSNGARNQNFEPVLVYPNAVEYPSVGDTRLEETTAREQALDFQKRFKGASADVAAIEKRVNDFVNDPKVQTIVPDYRQRYAMAAFLDTPFQPNLDYIINSGDIDVVWFLSEEFQKPEGVLAFREGAENGRKARIFINRPHRNEHIVLQGNLIIIESLRSTAFGSPKEENVMVRFGGTMIYQWTRQYLPELSNRQTKAIQVSNSFTQQVLNSRDANGNFTITNGKGPIFPDGPAELQYIKTLLDFFTIEGEMLDMDAGALNIVKVITQASDAQMASLKTFGDAVAFIDQGNFKIFTAKQQVEQALDIGLAVPEEIAKVK